MQKHTVTNLFALLLLMVACSPEEIDTALADIPLMNMPFEALGFKPRSLEFSKEKYFYDNSTGLYYKYFSNEFFYDMHISFSPENETSIAYIELSNSLYPDEHGKLKFSQISEILKSIYGKDLEIRLIEDSAIQHIWTIDGNIITLVGYSNSRDMSIYLTFTFHPETDLRILE